MAELPQLLTKWEFRLLLVGVIGFGGAAAFYLLALFTRPRGLRFSGTLLLLIAWMLVTLSLSARIAQAHRLPLQSRYDVTLWFVWCLVLVYLFVEDRTKVTLPGVIVALGATGIGAALLQADAAIWPVLPQYVSGWFVWRGVAFGLAYALLAVATAIELSSPLYAPLVRREAQAQVGRQERYLEFRGYAYRLVLLAFLVHSLAILSNARWRCNLDGRYWAWTHDETWALVIWLTYAAYLHLRTQAHSSRRLTIAICLAGGLAVGLAYLGVSWQSGFLW
ncbi:MAG: cytochrome c biogenesis protein CcsA [candidate division WOR-3 bacterium]